MIPRIMELEEALKILAAFDRERVEYVLVGSMGMAVLGVIRATRDIDVFVAPDEANVSRLRRALASVFDDPSIDEITSTDLAGDYPAIQYAPPSGDFSIDLLARLGERFRFDEIEWQEVTIDGIRVRVATPRMLYRMKRDTVRPQDKLDASALRDRFDLEDE
jgi:nucleotidyltransferase AbiEii toxin of type IV toxin-antitoxin system